MESMGIGDGVTCLQEFKLYKTYSNFYMVGADKTGTCCKVLKIGRLEQFELNITEDPTSYSDIECSDLLKRIDDGNRSTGGLKFVTMCYGIVGFIKFLGPYYMIIITERRKIGTICGHAIYSIAKRDMIPISHSTMKSKMAYSKNDENRYKKLLCSMDLTKDFYFSYSYRVMFSLQKNLCNHQTGMELYETMFVWNEFLTRGIRNQLKNSIWTVPLVYGFFKQVELSLAGREFNLILIARRSRHYAGTRYLKRGVNEKGRVANDVETEQIVLEPVQEGCPMQISSVVQIRGSIPLFWSQETSILNIQPDIILSNKDYTYKATKLHFQNLVKRYGNPIIILNLIKIQEKKPRESILRSEFVNAIEVINKDLAPEDQLKFLHWDLSNASKKSVSSHLDEVVANTLNLNGFFHGRVLPSSRYNIHSTHKDPSNFITETCLERNDYNDDKDYVDESHCTEHLSLQKGVLRTNCIDCLDRTNFVQYAYGRVALFHQLRSLGYVDIYSSISSISSVIPGLLKVYQEMGDTLALQYGGSAAHNKIFSEKRGKWNPAKQPQYLFRSIQRYYSNVYMDAEKQEAINVFLGHFQPQHGKPALWELDSDQHYDVGGRVSHENARSTIKRSLSEGYILCDSSISSIDEVNDFQMDKIHKPLPGEIPDSSYIPVSSRQHSPDTQLQQYLASDSISLVERKDSLNCSNFLVADWLSSSGTSCEEDTCERSLSISPPAAGSSDDERKVEGSTASALKVGSSSKYLSQYSDQFISWVTHGSAQWP